MQKSLWLGGLVGGVIFFIWSAISHMFLPWHDASYHAFSNEDAIGQMMNQGASEDGIYIYPMGDSKNPNLTDEQRMKAEEEAWTTMMTGPFAFIVLQKDGTGGMGKLMGLSLIFDILAAALVAWLLLKTTGLSYMGKITFIVIFSVAASLTMSFPNWIWWGFPTGYTMVNLVDSAIGWFLAGLGMGKVVK